MPSVFGHGVTGIALGVWAFKKTSHISLTKFLLVSFIAANLPDIDVLFHHLQLDHIEFLAHRNGFFHSIFFAFLMGPILGFSLFGKESTKIKIRLSLYLIALIFSHGLLDSMTKGVGVAFLYPLSSQSYTFPLTPLLPAGFNMEQFSQGMVIMREFLFIWLPGLVLIILGIKKPSR